LVEILGFKNVETGGFIKLKKEEIMINIIKILKNRNDKINNELRIEDYYFAKYLDDPAAKKKIEDHLRDI
jgi:hypothetical protein